MSCLQHPYESETDLASSSSSFMNHSIHEDRVLNNLPELYTSTSVVGKVEPSSCVGVGVFFEMGNDRSSKNKE